MTMASCSTLVRPPLQRVSELLFPTTLSSSVTYTSNGVTKTKIEQGWCCSGSSPEFNETPIRASSLTSISTMWNREGQRRDTSWWTFVLVLHLCDTVRFSETPQLREMVVSKSFGITDRIACSPIDLSCHPFITFPCSSQIFIPWEITLATFISSLTSFWVFLGCIGLMTALPTSF